MIILVGFLVFVGVGASINHFFQQPYNEGFLAYPGITGIHVISGGIYLLLAPFQFVAGIRTRWIKYHRYAGRALVIIGVFVGLSAVFIAIVIPFSGWIESVINGFFGVLFLVALVKSFLMVRSKNIDLHREWMIRAFAIGLGIATMRLIFIPALIIAGSTSHQTTASLSIIAFTIAFISHVGVAEFWIRKTRVNS